MKKVADYVREARAEYGLSQRALSNKLGGYTIAPIESGTYLPSEKAAKKLAQALNLPTTFFDALHQQRGLIEKSAPRIEEDAPSRVLPLVGEIEARGFELPISALGRPENYVLEEMDLLELVDDERAFAVRVRGDALLPVFANRDRLVVSPARAYLPGDPVILRTVDGKFFCGFVAFEDDDVVLRLPAKASKPMRFPKENVIWIFKVVLRIIA